MANGWRTIVAISRMVGPVRVRLRDENTSTKATVEVESSVVFTVALLVRAAR
jgi:hypothetical protein